jgi:hypothetical protein
MVDGRDCGAWKAERACKARAVQGGQSNRRGYLASRSANGFNAIGLEVQFRRLPIQRIGLLQEIVAVPQDRHCPREVANDLGLGSFLAGQFAVFRHTDIICFRPLSAKSLYDLERAYLAFKQTLPLRAVEKCAAKPPAAAPDRSCPLRDAPAKRGVRAPRSGLRPIRASSPPARRHEPGDRVE